MHYLLDMDGVCVDTYSKIGHLMTPGSYELADPSIFNTWTVDDWRRLPATKNWLYLYAMHKDFGPVTYCTSPTWGWYCAAGKVQWLQDRHGYEFRDYIITPHKHLMASKDTCLVDDCEANCEAFAKAGGNAILCPSMANHMWEMGDEEALLHVIRSVEKESYYAADL